MTMSYDEVVAYLRLDEPRRGASAGLDADAAEHLARIVAEGDPQLSVKAALALSVTGAAGHRGLVRELAQDPRPVMRVAAARAAATLGAERRDRLLVGLLDDDDAGVQKEAIRAASEAPSPEVVARLRQGGWRSEALGPLADAVVQRAGG